MDNQPMLTENFLIALNHSDNLEELNEVKLKIDEEILRTRSNDKGGQDGMIFLEKKSKFFIDYFSSRF